MDYIDAFRNLKTNNKYGRKSPHKAILMLTVIELYEKNILTDNEIHYDDTLKSMFMKIWNRVLPDEPLFHPEAYLPFWYLQSDSFWHIVPIRGKEDILSLMRDNNIKPSETKLYDSVNYAELDEDLYFLMTLPSGRSSLKKVLLETYTTLSDTQIERLAESKDNAIDYYATALSDYEKILAIDNDEGKKTTTMTDNEHADQFQCLNEDVQLALNIVYFTFLKKHPNEREMFKEVCPTVYDLLDKIVNHPIKQGEITPSFSFVYDNFLSDLKVALLSEDGSIGLIDKIEEAIGLLRGNNNENGSSLNSEESQPIVAETKIENEEKLSKTEDSFIDDLEIEHVYLDVPEEAISTSTDIVSEQDDLTENRKGKAWTEDEEQKLKLYYLEGVDFLTIASVFGRTEIAIKSRLAKLGLIEYTYEPKGVFPIQTTQKTQGQTKESNFVIENFSDSATLWNEDGELVFRTEGKFKYLHDKLYRLNLKRECFTLKGMVFDGSVWTKGTKKIVAYPMSALYGILNDSVDYCEDVEDIVDSSNFVDCKIKVRGIWFSYNGNVI